METARDSQSKELAENLIGFFIEMGDKECFTACLYNCYDLLRPDVVLELAWKNKMMDAAMPYVIQATRQYTSRIDQLDKKEEQKEAEDKKKKSATNDFNGADMAYGGMGPGGPGFGHLAIGNAPFQPQVPM